MDIKPNIFIEWTAAKKDTWFTTRSPYSGVPCYIAPVALPTCSNYSSYLSPRASFTEIRSYLEAQVRILHFNNPKHTGLMIKAAIHSRMIYWLCNSVLQKDPYYLTGLLDEVIEECLKDTEFVGKIQMEKTRYWYSDEIIKMPADGSRTSNSYKAKLEARRGVISGAYKDDFRVATQEYKFDNYNVLPTIKILSNNTGRSREIINVYGKEFVISQLDNTKQRVQKVREFFPKLKKQEVADLLNLSLITVKRNWWSKEEVAVV